jgi:hypothetical protein
MVKCVQLNYGQIQTNHHTYGEEFQNVFLRIISSSNFAPLDYGNIYGEYSKAAALHKPNFLSNSMLSNKKQNGLIHWITNGES